MKNKLSRRTLAALVSLVAVLCFGAATASAHGGPGGRGIGGASVSSLVTQAAKELDVSRANLVSAIEKSAVTRIDAAVDDGDLSADRADDLKEEVQDNLNAAYSLSQTSTVASNLSITTAALNTGFKNARKALATAKIDAELAAGRISSAEATDLKTQLGNATLSGYKAGLGGGFGSGEGFGKRH
jgi:hypothetical protein